jgi:DNA-binding transcriptional LysR family regulator
VRRNRLDDILPNVSLHQIEYFVTVAEEGNVGRAARSLRIAQPAVSRQIRHLEEELGAALFERTSRGMKLSEPGRVFLEHARVILERVRAARDAIQFGAFRSKVCRSACSVSPLGEAAMRGTSTRTPTS